MEGVGTDMYTKHEAPSPEIPSSDSNFKATRAKAWPATLSPDEVPQRREGLWKYDLQMDSADASAVGLKASLRVTEIGFVWFWGWKVLHRVDEGLGGS